MLKKDVSFHCIISKLVVASAFMLPHAAAFAAGSYFTLEAGYKEFRHADIQATLDSPNSPVGAADGNIDGYGIDATLGFPVPNLPVPIGSKPLFELQLHYGSADDEHRQAPATGLIGFIPVDGSAVSDGVPAATLVYETEFDYYGVDALVRTELSHNATKRVTAFGGLTFARFSQSHDFTGRDPSGALITNALVRDDVDTDYFGIALGVSADHDLGSKWILSTTGRVDLLYADADMDVSQQLTIFGTVTQSDSDTDFAARLHGKIGLAKDFGSFVVGANATVDYLSYAPRVEHALFDTNPFPSRLDDDNLTSYGVNLYLKMLF